MQTTLQALLAPILGTADTGDVAQTVHVAPLQEAATGLVSRAQLAQALGLVLFHQLMARVPTGQAYVSEVRAQGRQVVFDHGAVRTVASPCGALPPGDAAIIRILRPLGYALQAVYPLPRLSMTGRAWCHADAPQDLPQFFVSELHPDRFSEQFQAAVARVVSRSVDPLKHADIVALEQLARDKTLPLSLAQQLLPQLVACFGRQHPEPLWSDYQILRQESPEMAWISTEGNAFNHATDRVQDIHAVAQAQRAEGRPIKDSIEVSGSGRIQQTAFRADPVQRPFRTEQGTEWHTVPGSFYEFIQRAHLPQVAGEPPALDLAFDAGNATGIFSMTAAAGVAENPSPPAST